MESIRRAMNDDPFAASIGVQLVELEPGRARATLTVSDRHLNSVGLVHGGVLFTLAAFAFFAAANSAGRAAVGINTNLSFVRPTRAGALWADAVELSRSRRLSTSEVSVTDDSGELVAIFKGTAYIKDEPFPAAS